MEEVSNITLEEVQEIVVDFPIQPRHSWAIITLNVQDDKFNLSDSQISEVQYLIAKGPMIRDIEVGQKIIIDPTKMLEKVHNDNNSHEDNYRIKIDPVQYKDRIYTYVTDNVIKSIDNREEE